MTADFAAAYASGDPAACALLGGPHGRLFGAPGPVPAPLPEVVAEINAHQVRLGTAARIPDGARFIVTGQQPGIFAGPMYTVYKAATAVLLAKELEVAAGAPCVPVFWTASEDHDFDEVRAAHFLDARRALFSLSLTAEDPPSDRPLFAVPATEALHALIDEAAARCAGSELTAEVAAFLHDTAAASDSLADWFQRVMACLFGGTPLVHFAPHWPAARAAARGVLRREIETPLVSTRLVNEAAAVLERLGHAAGVRRPETACNFFLLSGGRRLRVHWQDGRFTLPDAPGGDYEPAALLDLLEAEPGRFSPNVVLRPVVQQALFGAAACVCGPGETVYWAQLGGVFDHFDTPFPVVWPRARAVILGAKERKHLRAFGLPVEALAAGADAVVDRALRDAPPPEALAEARRRRDAMLAEAEALRARLGEGPAADAAAKLAEAVGQGFDRVERALLHGDREKVAALAARARRLCDVAMPGGRPQERALSPFTWLFSEGFGFTDAVLRGLDPRAPGVQEMEIG